MRSRASAQSRDWGSDICPQAGVSAELAGWQVPLGTPTLPRPDPFSPPLRGALSSTSPVTAHWGRTQAPIWLPVAPKEFSGMGHTQAPSSYSVEPSVTAGLGPSSIWGEVGMKQWPAGHGGIGTQSLEPLPKFWQILCRA